MLNPETEVLVYFSGSGGGHTKSVCRKTNRVRTIPLHELTRLRSQFFYWRYVLSVFKRDGSTESSDVISLVKYRQPDLLNFLKDEHARLIRAHQDEGVMSIGWIAICSGEAISEEESDKVYVSAFPAVAK